MYGQSRVEKCPFCGRQATTENSQGVPVCLKHKKRELLNLKCICGGWLDLRKGKWGPYFNCMDCGNMSWWKGLELNPQNEDDDEPGKEEKEDASEKKDKPKETVITSDDVDFL